MLRIYTASKLSHAPMWRALHESHPEVYFHARWLKHTLLGTPDEPAYARRFWMEDLEDIHHSDGLFLYAEPDDKLRGALVEVGAALAWNIPVVAIGFHPDYGTWQWHPGVHRVPTIEDAIEKMRGLQS